MKAIAIVFAVWVLAVPCTVAAFLTLALLADSASGIALFLAISVTAAATAPAILDLPLLRDSQRNRAVTKSESNHSKENTHAKCFDPQLDS